MSLAVERDIAGLHGGATATARGGATAVGKLEAERVAPAEWDGIAAGFDDVVQEQLCAYARTRWPGTEPEPLVFRRDGEIVGGALVMVQQLPLRLGSIGICKWGPMLRTDAWMNSVDVYAGMVEALIGEYAERRRMMLSILPRAATGGHNAQIDYLMARGFRRGTTVRYPARYIVRLDLPEAAQRNSLGQKWRYHLNKAEKAGLTFERAAAERLAEFDALYAAMGSRKNFPDHAAYDTIAPLFAAEPESLRPELFFVRHGEAIVAGAIIFKAGDTAVYLFGATNDAALPLRAGYFMHWRIIEWLSENTSARWYDLGGTDGFMGLHQFKKGMVGSAGVVSDIPPVANFAAYRWPLLIGTAAFSAREVANRLAWHLDVWRGSRARPDQPRPGRDGRV
jgi:hypothetical protein